MDNFDPTTVSPNSVLRDYSSGCFLPTQAWEMSANGHISEAFVSPVLEGNAIAEVSMLVFRDRKRSVARVVRRHLELWSHIASSNVLGTVSCPAPPSYPPCVGNLISMPCACRSLCVVRSNVDGLFVSSLFLVSFLSMLNLRPEDAQKIRLHFNRLLVFLSFVIRYFFSSNRKLCIL